MAAKATAKRGTRIVAINTLKERAMECFANQKSPLEMLSFNGSKISHYSSSQSWAAT